jgi:hypothetical protein
MEKCCGLGEVLLKCLWHLLEYLSVRDENHFSKTCQMIHQLVYTWRHWSVCGVPCLTHRKICSPGNLFSPSNRFLIPKHNFHAPSILRTNHSLTSRHHENYYLLFQDTCGWGVHARKVISCYEIIDFYAGELISSREASRRYEKYDNQVLLPSSPSRCSWISRNSTMFSPFMSSRLLAPLILSLSPRMWMQHILAI